jgi:hypothetical protein
MKKGIVFCHTCNRIVGVSFPVNHYHDFGNGEIACKMLVNNQLGFGFYKDTVKNRKFLAKQYPPQDEITIRLR